MSAGGGLGLVDDFGGVGIGDLGGAGDLAGFGLDPTGGFISGLPSFAKALGGGTSSAKSSATSVTDIVFANPFNFGGGGGGSNNPVQQVTNAVLPIAALAVGGWILIKTLKR